MRLPQVVTTSYLPEDRDLRAHRLSVHIQTLEYYLKHFESVGTVLSGYTEREADMLDNMGVDIVYHSHTPKKKAFKQNKVLKRLYSRGTRPVLLTDDDVVCNDEDALANVKAYLDEPDSMPAPCVAVLCMGRAAAQYFHQDRRVRTAVPPSMCGWALLIRPDFELLYDLEALDPYDVDDMVLRVTAAARGKLIVMDSGCRFKSIVPESQTKSVLTDFVMKRKIGLAGQRRVLIEKYPKLFVRTSTHLKFAYQVPSMRKAMLRIKAGHMVRYDSISFGPKSCFLFNDGGYEKWEASFQSIGLPVAAANDQLDAWDTLLDSKQFRINEAIRDGQHTAGRIASSVQCSLQLVLEQYEWLVHKGHGRLVPGKTKAQTVIEMRHE